MPRHSIGRRDFLKKSALAGSTAALSAGVFSEVRGAASKSPNEKLNIGCVGVANRAAANIDGLKSEAIVALCDVDENYLDRVHQQFPDARLYSDYREMIDKEAGTLDALVVSTPDHHHAPATIRGLRAGMNVYCEKPLTHTVQEARLIAETAREHNAVTQMGTQIHAEENYHRVVEMIQSGVIGDISEVHVWVGKGWGGGERPETGETPPPSLKWDLWIGPAPERPFSPGRYHPANWRRWWDFGGGTIGDMACHFMDLPFWALDLRHPTSVAANGPEVHVETCPVGLTVNYEFPARGDLPPVNLTWYDGERIPREVAGERVPGNGVMFIGSEGKMFADYGKYRLFPKEKFAAYQPPTPSIPRPEGHHAQFIQACKGLGTTSCNFDYSGALTEAVLLGNVAYRTGEKLAWDAKNLRAPNCPAADDLIRKEYREGWEV